MEILSNTESFSYGWLTSSKKSSDIDPDSISLQQADDSYVEFDFGLPSSNSSVLVQADKIFANGLLLPLHLVTPSLLLESESEFSKSSDSVLRRSISLESYSESFHSRRNQYLPRSSCDNVAQSGMISLEHSPLIFHSFPSTPASNSTKLKLPFLRNCARKYLCFLLPLCKKVKGLRLISLKPAVRTIPKRSVEGSRENTTFDVREESSIYEAVLHCKKSVVCPVKDA